jgi:hypothetical protein
MKIYTQLVDFAIEHKIHWFNERDMLSEIQYYLRDKYGLIATVKPILGKKNGYDSFPIEFWSYDTLILNNNTSNSYYVNFSKFVTFLSDAESMLYEDEELSDIEIYTFDTYEQALAQALTHLIIHVENELL